MARALGQVFLQRQCPESLGENAAIAMGILCFPGLCSQHCLETRSYCLDRKRACFSLGIWTWIRIHIPTMPSFVKMTFFKALVGFFQTQIMAPNNYFPYSVCLGVRFSWNKHPFAYWHEGFMLFWVDSDFAMAGRWGVAGRDGCLSGNWHLWWMASNVTDTLETLFQLILTITWADIMQVLQAKNVIRWLEQKSHSWWEWNLGWIPRSHFKPSLFLLPVPGSLTDLFKFHFLRRATW